MGDKNVNKAIPPEESEKKDQEPLKEDELSRVTKERDEYLAGWQRAKADFINYKKEELQRLREIARIGGEEVIRDLIPVVDSFELGLVSIEKAGPVEKGVYMIKSQLEDVLRSKGLERIRVSPGDQFNPSFQEAVGVMDLSLLPADKKWVSGTVAEEVEAGYMYQGKLLRPTRVRLVK